MTQMRVTRRSLLLVFCLAAANVPAPLRAIEAQQSAPRLQRLVAEARQLVTVIRTQKEDVRNLMGRPEQPPSGDPTRMFSNSFEYRELKRSASRMTEIGNSIYTLASRCGADGKTVADNFKTGARHLNTHVNRIASSSSPTTARIAIDDIDRDLEEIAGNLQHVANVPECSPDSADDEKDASKSE
jgi:hypothetical protein